MAMINLTLTDDQQREICLDCQLPDCVGLESRYCPIQEAQRAIWRAKDRARKAARVSERETLTDDDPDDLPTGDAYAMMLW